MLIPLLSAANRNMTHYQITVDICQHLVAVVGISSDRHLALFCHTHKLRDAFVALFQVEIVSAWLRTPTKACS